MKIQTLNKFYGPNRFYIHTGGVYLISDISDHKPESCLSETIKQLHLLSPLFKHNIAAVELENASNKAPDTLFRYILEQLFYSLNETFTLHYHRELEQQQIAWFFSCEDVETGEQAATLSARIHTLLNHAQAASGSDDIDFNVHETVMAFRQQALQRQYSLSLRAILNVARDDGIAAIEINKWPIINSSESHQSALIQLGYCNHRRLISDVQLQELDAPVLALNNNRQQCLLHLYNNNLSVALKDNESFNINTRKRAIRRANQLGYPVVLKSLYKNRQAPSLINIQNDQQLCNAYQQLGQFDRHVCIEKHISGTSYRLFVLNGKVVAAHQLQPLVLSGDGVHSIAELADMRLIQLNQKMRSHIHYQGMHKQSIPANQQQVIIQQSAESRYCSSFKDVLANLHPALSALAIKAAKLCSSPIAGIDLICTDLRLRPDFANSTIINIDIAPDLAIHRQQNEFLPLNLAKEYIKYIFASRQRPKIPLISVTGTNGKTTSCRMVTNILQKAGYTVGLACTDGVYIDGKTIVERVSSGVGGALTVLTQPQVDAAVLEASRGSLLQMGLAFKHCDIAACTNIANDHLELLGIDTLDQMAALKRIVLETARQAVVLNADDTRCMAMAPFLRAKQLLLISLNQKNPILLQHLNQGLTAVYLQTHNNTQHIVIAKHKQHTLLMDAKQIPATWNGRALHNIENALFAIAITLAMDIPVEVIRLALQSQGTTLKETPGRLNLYEKLPFPVILDYAHNAHGLKTLSALVSNIACKGKKILVLFYRDDARQQDILDAAQAVAEHFNLFICRDSASPEQNYTGITSNILKSCLLQSGVPGQQIKVEPDPKKALHYALQTAQAGDVLTYITGPMVKIVWQQLEEFKAAR